jgi:hypothetical protein
VLFNYYHKAGGGPRPTVESLNRKIVKSRYPSPEEMRNEVTIF